MPLHPDAEPIVRQLNEAMGGLGTELTDVSHLRELMAEGKTAKPAVEVARAAERRITGPDGDDLRLRAYWPVTVSATPGVVVYCHGGGWVLGDLDTHDGVARRMANDAGAVVLAVDYRRAPEHRFPAAAEDAYAALLWAAGHARELGADPDRLAVAGDSAGGNLAAVAALMARERNGPDLALQLLVYPVTDHDFTTQSYVDSTSEGFLVPAHMRWFWDQYAPEPDERDDPRAAPLRAADLGGLAPAHVVTAECDPLRDEGQRYAARLRESDVEVTLQHCPGTFHGFFDAYDVFPLGAEEVTRAHARLARAVAGPAN